MSIDQVIRGVLDKEMETLNSVADSIGNMESMVKAILSCNGKLVVTGMGKSGLIGRKISATFSSTATPSSFVHPAEALHGDIGTIGEGDLVVAVSNSGETEELLALIPYLKRRQVPIAAMCCRTESTLARQADFVIPLSVTEEADPFGLIPTCSTTAMLAVGDALAVAVLSERGLTREQFAERHPSGSLGRKLLLQVKDLMHEGAEIPKVSSVARLRDAVFEMGAKRLGATFVVKQDADEKLLGVFTDGDLRRQLEQNPNPLDLPIEKVMSKHPSTIESNALAVDAVAEMQEKQITVLPVMHAESLVGAIHLHDLLKAGLG